jgi:hypothetical protein
VIAQLTQEGGQQWCRRGQCLGLHHPDPCAADLPGSHNESKALRLRQAAGHHPFRQPPGTSCWPVARPARRSATWPDQALAALLTGHVISPALAAAGEVLAVSDQPLVQLAGEHWNAVHPSVVPEL